MKVIIAGDSYSASTAIWHQNWDKRCVGMSGFSNRDIYHSLKQYSGWAVINLSSLHRLPRSKQTWDMPEQYGNARLYKLNCEYAKRIIAQWKDTAVIWSPFPDYEQWDDVEWINLGAEDNMWASLYPRNVKYYGHLTLKGHAQLNTLLSNKLNQKINKNTHVKTTS